MRNIVGKYQSWIAFATSILLVANCVAAQAQEEDSLDALLESTVETASKYEQTVSEAPASITIITRDDIQTFGYRTLGEVLNTIPGFYLSNDRNYTYVGVRGFSRPTDFNNRILILLNGLAINENYYNSAYVETAFGVDLKMVERIEVVRGPNSALYGIGAMLGVVNIITRKTDSLSGFETEGRIGSHNLYETAGRYGQEFKDGSMLIASGQWGDTNGEDLYFKEFDSPTTNNGISQGLDWDEYYNLYSMYKKEGFSLQMSAVNRKKGIPTSAYEMAFNDPRAMTSDGRFLLDALYHKDLSSNKQLKIRGYYQRYHYFGDYPEPEGLLWRDENDGAWFGGQLQYLWDFRTDNRLAAGAEFTINPEADYFSAYVGEDVYFARDYSYSTVSFYLQDEYQILPSLSLTAGLRHDHYSNGGSKTSPRAALIYHPFADTTLKLLYGEGFRAPNVYERTFVIEPYKLNPNIKPETIHTFELVAEHKISRNIFASASLYRIKINNLIDTLEDPDDGTLFFGNTEETHTDGVEFQMQSRFKKFQAYSNFSYQWAHNSLTEEQLTNSPRFMLRSGFSAKLTNSGTAGFELFYESKRKTIYETYTDPFWVSNLNLKGKLPEIFNNSISGLDKLFWGVKIDNLFDRKYCTPGGFEHVQPDIIQPGRRVSLEIGFDF